MILHEEKKSTRAVVSDILRLSSHQVESRDFLFSDLVVYFLDDFGFPFSGLSLIFLRFLSCFSFSFYDTMTRYIPLSLSQRIADREESVSFSNSLSFGQLLAARISGKLFLFFRDFSGLVRADYVTNEQFHRCSYCFSSPSISAKKPYAKCVDDRHISQYLSFSPI